MTLRNRPTSLGGLPIQIDYTARDYDSIRDELLNLASQITPEWTDREAGDIGVTIIEAVSYVADILSYQLDRVQNESYLATAQTREAVTNILRLIDYQLSPASPATVSMVIRVDRAVTLPVGFTVRTNSSLDGDVLEYQLTQAVSLPIAGLYCVPTDVPSVTRIFNEPSSTANGLVFTAGEAITNEVLGTSDGTPEQIYLLNKEPVCLSSNGIADIVVVVGNETYIGKTSFLGSGSTDAVFVFAFTSDERVLIKFGDGLNGKIPPNSDIITVSYRIGGGEFTNRAGVGSITDFDLLTGVTEVYNVSRPSGGSDPETVSEAKKKGPRSIRALDRCVTLDDFESMALLTPGGSIRAARAVQGLSSIDVDLYIAAQGDQPVPSGAWYPSIQSGFGDIGAVGRWLNEKKPVPTRLNLYPPTVVNPFFKATVFVQRNLLRDSVAFDVDSNLQVLFNEITDDFGEGVPLSAVLQAIENTNGVDYVTADALYRLPTARYLSGNKEALNDATLTFSAFYETMSREVYKIEWISSTQFYLRISSGLIKDSSNTVITYSSDQSETVIFYNDPSVETQASEINQFDLTIIAGGTYPPSSGDIWEFSVDDYLGNIETQSHEILVAELGADGKLDTNQINLTYSGGI